MPAGLRIHAGLGKNTLFLAGALSGKKRKIFSQPIHPLTDGGDPLVNWGKLCVVVKRGPPTLRGGVTGLQAGNPSKAVPRRFAARLATQPAALARRPLVGGCRAHRRTGDHSCAKHLFHCNQHGSRELGIDREEAGNAALVACSTPQRRRELPRISTLLEWVRSERKLRRREDRLT